MVIISTFFTNLWTYHYDLSPYPASLCCSSGYEFTLIPPQGVYGLTCNPYSPESIVSVVCEVKGNEPVEIDWYFNSSSTLSETKLMNTSKHSIRKQYTFSSLGTDNILKSVLTLQNLNDNDAGQYICSGHLSSGRFRLLPRPTFLLLSSTMYVHILSHVCEPTERKIRNPQPCADTVSVSPQPPLAASSHVVTSDQIPTTSSLTVSRFMETAYFVKTSSILTTTLSPANLSSYPVSTNVPLPTFTSNIIKSKLLVTASPMPTTLTGLSSASTNVPVPTFTTESKLFITPTFTSNIIKSKLLVTASPMPTTLSGLSSALTNVPVPTFTTESKLFTTSSPAPTNLIGLSSITTILLISNKTMHASPISSTISTSAVITRSIIKSRLMHPSSIDQSSYTLSTTFLISSDLTTSDLKMFSSPTTITQIQPALLSTNAVQSIFSSIIPQVQPAAFDHPSSDILIWIYLITVLLVVIFLVMIISLITMVICLYVRGAGSFRQSRDGKILLVKLLYPIKLTSVLIACNYKMSSHVLYYIKLVTRQNCSYYRS